MYISNSEKSNFKLLRLNFGKLKRRIFIVNSNSNISSILYWQGAKCMVGKTESTVAIVVVQFSLNHAHVQGKQIKRNIKMAHNSCCLVNCKNTSRNNDWKCYTFPVVRKLEIRKMDKCS